EALGRFDRRGENLHAGIGERRQVITERIHASFDGLRLVAAEEFFDPRKVRRRLGNKGFERHKSVSKGAELLLNRGILGPAHSPTDQRRFEAGFPDRTHDPDRVRRKAGDVNYVWAGPLDRSHDRSEVDLVRREAAIVNDLEIILLGPMPGADRCRLWK